MHTFLLVLAVVGGCSDSGGGTVTGDPVPLTDLAAKFSAASCGVAFKCCTAAEISAQYGTSITTEAGCDTSIAGLLNSLAVPAYQASIAAGRISYDAAAAGDCVALLNSVTCAEYSADMSMTTVSGCGQFLIPKVANDGACSQSYECTSGNCEGANSSPPTDGACKPVPTVGQTCEFTCASGAYCAGTTCAAQKANGAACNNGDQCTSGRCETTCMSAANVCDGI